jgi:hypothetical protein
MPEQKKLQWMPVFVVVPATKELSVSLHEATNYGTTYTAPKNENVSYDYWQRVGTARARSDGGFDVQLTAVPINGRLIIRPAKEHESIDPTLVTSK